jgi:hypothetical protein
MPLWIFESQRKAIKLNNPHFSKSPITSQILESLDITLGELALAFAHIPAAICADREVLQLTYTILR